MVTLQEYCHMQFIILQLDATSCHLQLNWSCLQLQNCRILYGLYIVVRATNMQLLVYKMDTCHKNIGLR
jgi:hypothetical protein